MFPQASHDYGLCSHPRCRYDFVVSLKGSISTCFNVRFRGCCDRALKSVLQLAAMTSGQSEASIESAYRKLCQTREDAFLFKDDELEEDEILPQDVPEENGQDDNEAEKFLGCLAQERSFLDPEVDSALPPEAEALEAEWADISNSDQFKTLLQDPESLLECPKPVKDKEVQSGESMPWNLMDALRCKGCPFNALFRLAVRLRSHRGGCDTPWVPKARNVRRASKNLNWHQLLGLKFFLKCGM